MTTTIACNDAIRRTFDPALFNRVANHPEVLPHLKAAGVVDVAQLVDNTANFALEAEGGGFILIQHEPGIYEVHSMFLPEARTGTHEAMLAGFDYMFARTDCYRILTQVPDDNRAAMALAHGGGFRKMFRRAGSTYLALDIEDWAMRTERLEAVGAWFHDTLEDAKHSAGSALPHHDDDPAHERAVGAAVLMMQGGNVPKAVAFYNRWARLAGYAAITAFSYNPPVIDVVDAVVEVMGQDMRVLLCR